jgi:hypothetical protein
MRAIGRSDVRPWDGYLIEAERFRRAAPQAGAIPGFATARPSKKQRLYSCTRGFGGPRRDTEHRERTSRRRAPICGFATALMAPRATGSTFGRHHRPRNLRPQRAPRGPPRALGPAARRPGADPGARRGHGRSAGGASGLLCRDYKGKEPIGWCASTQAWSRWSPSYAVTGGSRRGIGPAEDGGGGARDDRR